MCAKYLFITQSDLSPQDSNGRTLRDVFGYVQESEIYSFCTKRANKRLTNTNTFCVGESELFRKKEFHKNPTTTTNNYLSSFSKLKKNPLTCLLRNLAWNLSFIFWRKTYKKWLLSIKPDYIIFNPGDFLFMSRLSIYTSKLLKKKLIIYNTEDYYFKTWNYLHSENGFNWLYPLFRRKLIKTYNRLFDNSKLVLHNTAELSEEFYNVFPQNKHLAIYHPSTIQMTDGDLKGNLLKQFYYCGTLDKKRDITLLKFAEILKEIIPNMKIIVNGPASLQTIKRMKEFSNIEYLGIIEYSEVVRQIKKRQILLSLNSLDQYDLADKKHAFSTKMSDYIASKNIIFHISLANDEYSAILNRKLGFASSNFEEVKKNLSELKVILDSNVNPFEKNMDDFYETFLSPQNVYSKIKNEVDHL